MRSVFVSTGAFLGRIDGETRCALWADDPSEHGFDPARLIAVDLARTPTAAAAGTSAPQAHVFPGARLAELALSCERRWLSGRRSACGSSTVHLESP
jgi:hypothetical protein